MVLGVRFKGKKLLHRADHNRVGRAEHETDFSMVQRLLGRSRRKLVSSKKKPTSTLSSTLVVVTRKNRPLGFLLSYRWSLGNQSLGVLWPQTYDVLAWYLEYT